MPYPGGGRGRGRGGNRGRGRGGNRGDQRPPYDHGGAGGSGGSGGGPPSPSTLLPHQGAYGVLMAVYRPTGQAPAYMVPAQAGPPISFSPAPPAATVTIRAPPPSSSSWSSTTSTPAAPPSSSAPAPPPRQPSASVPPQSASTPASEPAPAASSAPSTGALAKEVEKKLFVSETALAPPAATAQQETAAAARAGDDASDVDLAPVTKLAHPARPGLATVGKKVMIRANHFLVNVADNSLFRYDVAINPESKSRATNREVLNELIKLHGETELGGKLPAYDGRKSLYTAGSLPFESEEFFVTLVDQEKKEKERVEREYKITIRIAGRTDMYHLQQFLRGRQRDMPEETIQVLDVVLRALPSWNYVSVSRSFFSTTFGHRGDIGEGLECWRGYYQSLNPTQMGLSLNIDISATSLFKPVTVIKFVEEFLNLLDTSRPLSDRDRVKIKKALRFVQIETTHQQDQIRRYKITGVTPIPRSQLIFPVDDKGTRQTVVQYFWDKYNYRLKYGSWPFLQASNDSRFVYLPMEVCKILEGQRYSKKLNDRQVTNILRGTCKRPQEWEQSIRDIVLHNKYADDKFAQEFGIQVSSDLVSVPACVLPPPLLKYHDSGREKTCAPSVGQWNMINKKMINGGTIDNWTCLNFSRMLPEGVHRFCMDLTHMCNTTGMIVNPRPSVEIRSSAPNHIENALRDVHRRSTQMLAQQGIGNQLQLLIVILPEVSGSYGKIKRVCETDIGIVSQCCLPKHASRPNKQYLENVALKINVKVAGRNTVLERAFVRNGILFVSEVPTIIFGTHVTPPPPGEDSASSIASVMVSMDWPEITKYRGLVSAQPHRQEIIEDLFTVSKDPQKGHNVNGGMIRELLIAFRKKTNSRPERIIFYRDGVSEGQFSHVLLHEMDAIRKACASLEEGYLPPDTFVVVQKRNHTRLFPEVHGRRDITDKSGNILPGTVVDQKICHPTEFDFYLCSHAGIQVAISPESESGATNREVLNEHIKLHGNTDLGSKLPAYDDISATSFFKPVTVIKFLEFLNLRDTSRPLSDRDCVKIKKALCGVRIETTHQQDQIRRYKIAGVTPIPMSQLIFPVDDKGARKTFVSSAQNAQVIELRVGFYGKYCRVNVNKHTELGIALAPTLATLKLMPEECFFTEKGLRGLKKEMMVLQKMTVEIHMRMKGGVVPGPNINLLITLDQWIINDLQFPQNWYQCVYVPICLRRRGCNVDEVICLGQNGALLVLRKLMNWFENTVHKQKKSFGPGFSLRDLRYNPALGIIIHRPDFFDWEYLNEQRYRQNCGIILQFIDRYLKYEGRNNSICYPMHVESLKERIESMKPEVNYSSDEMRCLVFDSPATWSIQYQIGLILSLMGKYRRGFTSKDRSQFKRFLYTEDAQDLWELQVSDEDAAPEMKRAYEKSKAIILKERKEKKKKREKREKEKKNLFYAGNLGKLQFSRNLLSHAKWVSDLQVLVALYVLWKRLLPELHYLLVTSSDDDRWLECEMEEHGEGDQVVKRRKVSLPLVQQKVAKIGLSGYIMSQSLAERNRTGLKDIWDY